MSFIQRSAEDVDDATAAMNDKATAGFGYLPNMTKVFAGRADVMQAWEAMTSAIKSHMELRRYELVTLAAANELRSSYCMLAHGSLVLEKFFSADELRSIVEDADTRVLDETDRAIMDFARLVVRDAASITPGDLDALRSHGVSDAEIFDIATAAAARCFFSKTLDSVGARPDAAYAALPRVLRDALTVGRPIDDQGAVAAS